MDLRCAADRRSSCAPFTGVRALFDRRRRGWSGTVQLGACELRRHHAGVPSRTVRGVGVGACAPATTSSAAAPYLLLHARTNPFAATKQSPTCVADCFPKAVASLRLGTGSASGLLAVTVTLTARDTPPLMRIAPKVHNPAGARAPSPAWSRRGRGGPALRRPSLRARRPSQRFLRSYGVPLAISSGRALASFGPGTRSRRPTPCAVAAVGTWSWIGRIVVVALLSRRLSMPVSKADRRSQA